MPARNTLEVKRLIGELRSQLGDAVPTATLQALAEKILADLQAASAAGAAAAMAAATTEAMEEEAPDVPSRIAFDLMATIRSCEKACHYYCKLPDFASLEAILAWLDADGAFSAMRPFTTAQKAEYSADGQAPRDARGRQDKVLDLAETVVVYLLVYCRFRHNMQHVANLFSVALSMVETIYETWVCAIAFFSIHMMPWPTGAQAAATGDEG